MSAARVEALRIIGKRNRIPQPQPSKHSAQFASRVFNRRVMEEMLPRRAYLNLLNAMEGRERLDSDQADAIAEALKDWAVKNGATHFTHWFQPLTGASAEKHDSFIAWAEKGRVIERFRGQELLRGEPDASSFPSGGLRATHEARGYTAWDPASPPFLWEGAEGLTLCIPSVFFSWKGSPLDHKIPLLRSDEKLNKAALRLLSLCQVSAEKVFSTLGAEQEYFAVDRNLFLLRPDLLLAGRTVFGMKPSKGQELEDHYFGSVKDRVMAFMRDFEDAAVRLGIPVKTRHNEVAPAQHEIAPLFEKASLAVDHNLLLMELMRQTAAKHGLACLLHEKPFAFINGSGKHNNWSLATDAGLNLLDPKESSLVFLILLTAILRGVHEHAGLLRAAIASAGNDHRLGGNEAPPTILSVYLGEALEGIVRKVLHGKNEPAAVREIDLGLSHLPAHEADPADRNRTSFFAFTGNKFEFRAVGSSAHCGFPISAINAIVADSLQLILDEIADAVKDRVLSQEKLFEAALPVLRKHLKAAEPVLFNGNGYSPEWIEEAEKRGLPNIRRSFDAFAQLTEKKNIRVFEGILTEEELHSRYEILVEQYVKTMNIEANLMSELFRTQILPAALQDQKKRAESLISIREAGIVHGPQQADSLSELSLAIDQAFDAIEQVETAQKQSLELGWEAKGKLFSEIAGPKMEEARKAVDRLESLMDNALWPLPKYRELLFCL